MSAPHNRLIEGMVDYRRLVFSLVLLFIAVGLLALGSMSRQEDPAFPYRAGLIKVFYPGGTPLQIEKLITEPIEEELAQVSEINNLVTTSRDDLALITIELQDYVYDTDGAWERVRRAIERAQLAFPNGVSRIEFEDRQIDGPTAVLSITGSDDPILLEDAAQKLKRALVGLPGLSRIEIEGSPEKEVIVKLDQQDLEQLGISRQFIADTIAQRNRIIPGGLISGKNRNIRLNTLSDYTSLDELRGTVIALPSGQQVSLDTIAEVSIEPRLPLSAQIFQDGKRAVSLGIIAQRGPLDVIDFGRDLRTRVAQVKDTFAPLMIEESFFQPDYVRDRLDGLRSNLLLSVLIIAVIVCFALGLKTGLLVSAVLPVVSLISAGLYNAGGGIFHQMAVIGMVISLGILIDNAIVVVEYIEAALRKGEKIEQAFRDSIRVMAKPLLASTGTTIAAFIPLLVAKGGVGDFVRAVPTMIVIALVVSYLISIFVLPLTARYLFKQSQRLKQPPRRERTVFTFTDPLADRCANVVEANPKRVLVIIVLLLSVAVGMTPFLKQEFFPYTDRAQIIIDIEMPSNTPLQITSQVSQAIEAELLQHPSVADIYLYVGGAGFKFYYNTAGVADESHIARFTINTQRTQNNLELVNWVRDELKPKYPDVIFIPRLLGQGPPRPAPVEIRIKHADLGILHHASQQVKELLMSIEGVSELRSNLDIGTPELQLAIQDSAALSFGLQPQNVAQAVFAQSRGVLAGQYRYDNDPVPIRVRSSAGQGTSIDVIKNQNISAGNAAGGISATPLNQLAAMQPVWTPANLRHHNHQRTVSVLSQIKQGHAFNQILSEFNARLPSLELPDSVIIELGGDASASSEANSNIATGAPIAIGLLIFFMMYQFNSFRRIAIVFVTIPLAAVGVIPGLVLSGHPFGFQSLLGVIALIGIVINNAIVLIDFMDSALRDGDNINAAVRKALQSRTAPILLTTATTILGLLPLALSSSTLWPPMAWAIISGLCLSTMLTLVAVPALCTLFLGRRQQGISQSNLNAPKQIAGTAMLAVALGFFISAPEPVAASQESIINLDVAKVISLSTQNLNVASSQQLANASQHDYRAQRRNAWAPKLSVNGRYEYRDQASLISLPEPFGDVQVSAQETLIYEIKLTQPLFNPANQRYQTGASKAERDASQLQLAAAQHRAIGNALQLYTTIQSLEVTHTSLLALRDSLQARLQRIDKNVRAERALKTDQLQVQVALNQLQQQLTENQNAKHDQSIALLNALNLPSHQQVNLAEIDANALIVNHQNQQTTATCLARKDCQALEKQAKKLKLQAKAIGASSLPTVNLSLAEQRSDGLLFVAEKDQRALLEFAWPIFSGGQRSSEKQALKARSNSLNYQITDLQNAIQLQLQRAASAKRNAESAITLAQSSLELDQERTRLSRIRYENGLLNIDQLLDAEASLAKSKADLAIAKLSLFNAKVQTKLAVGEAF